MKADKTPWQRCGGRKKNPPGWILGCLLALSLAACTHIDYQDRPRSPLKPMNSVVHVKTDEFDTPPRVLEGMRPEYPELEANKNEKGFVSLICTIGTNGRVIEIEVEQMTNPAFAYEAARAVQKWRWAPAMKDGHPVVGKLRVPMHFNPV